MKFWEAMRAYEEGKKVRCKEWPLDDYLSKDGNSRTGPFFWREVKADWELFEESEQLLSFAEVVKGLREGKRYRRKFWEDRDACILAIQTIHFRGYLKVVNEHMQACALWLEDYEAADWVEVK